jgi:outer membrane receptor protein involved in Fe transport
VLQTFGKDWSTGQPWRFSRTGEPTGIWGGPAAHSYFAQVPAGLLSFRRDHLEITAHASTYKRAAPFNHRFVDSESDFDDPLDYELDRSLWVDVKHRARPSPRLQVETRLYADTFDYQRTMDVSAPADCLYATTCRFRTLGVSRWVGAEVQTSWDWRADDTLITLLGADGRLRHVGTITDRLDFDTGRPLESSTGLLDQDDGILGAYLQQSWHPAPWLGLGGGARLDVDRRVGQRLSPRAAASAQPWQGGTLKVIYAEAFRAPSWDEWGRSSPGQLPARALQSETVRSLEASIDQKHGPHHLLLGLFRSWWRDLVEQHVLTVPELLAAQRDGAVPLGTRSAAQFRNMSSLENYGVNALYDGALAGGALHYGATVTAAVARRTRAEGDTRLALAPQLSGNLRASCTLPGALPTLAVAGQLLGRRPAERAFDGDFATAPYAPAQLRLRGTVSGAVPLAPGLSYRASADWTSAQHGPYIVGPLQTGQSLEFYGHGQAPELNPVDTFRITLGLQYDFGAKP